MNLPFKIDLHGKVAVVTGAGGVICSNFAKALGACGAKVAVLDLNKKSADLVAQEITEAGGQAVGVEANVLEVASLKGARQIVRDQLGLCDILINGAGGNHPKGTTSKEYLDSKDLAAGEQEGLVTFFDLDPQGIEFVFNLNFLGTLLPTQVFLKDMVGKKDGVILNISSMNAFTPLTKIPAYSGAKAAVSNFTQWLAVHLSKVDVRVNAIAPGFFVTNQNRNMLFNADGSTTERAAKILNATPMGRFGECEELTGTLLWLVDHKASGFVNGVVVPVDGGFSAYSGV
ncbi:short-chain dehydrogenase/reductase sdr [Lucifera butyrica]|uniref:Short-chain dehydrogenase/reductase sdr n=1 Tax=Lucifera butyrica TaxID=1351585 RepID=A0A498R322_9FIRM|nr:SDR family oxidoreductase [Lucifera butyrica]VBB05791.1 short-chain dehydrogenase/reductase sdr [Lucifera butyrica]